MRFAIGDRVVTPCGEVGYLEEIDPDDGFVGVRLQTPNDEPSCMVTGGYTLDDLSDGANVVPMPKSAAWWAEAEAFNAALRYALEDAGL